MIKQVCFNTLKNDIFGSTIINYTSLTVNHRKQRRSCLQDIKPRFNRWIWKKNKCILSRVHKTWSLLQHLLLDRASMWWENQKSAVGIEKLAVSCYNIQYLLATAPFFDNVLTLHLYIIAITSFRVPRGAFNDWSHLKDNWLSLLSFM